MQQPFSGFNRVAQQVKSLCEPFSHDSRRTLQLQARQQRIQGCPAQGLPRFIATTNQPGTANKLTLMQVILLVLTTSPT